MPEDNGFMGGDIDTQALLEQFESEYTEPEGDNEEVIEDDTSVQEVADEQADVSDESTDEENPEQDPQNDPDLHKRNEAFKNMREEIKELNRYKALIERMAQDNGLQDPNEVFSMYENQALQREAEERGIDLESMQEIHNLRMQNEQKAIEEQRELFMQERTQVIEKYNLSDDDVQSIHDYVIDNNLQNLGFEQAYKLANFDNILDSARTEGRQQYLTDKKKRQQSAAVNAGTNNISNSDVSSGDLSDDEFQKTLKSMGVSLD